MTSWSVVYTQPNCERRAFENLRRQGYEAYLPFHRRRRNHARRIDIVARPLFPRYLFVALDLSVERWRPILGTFGVSNLLRHGDSPQTVPEGVVEALQAGESLHAFDEVDPILKLIPGDKVRILSGAFVDLIGRFQGLADSDRVFVLLDLLGREVKMRIPTRTLAVS